MRRLAAVSVPWAFRSTPAGSACCSLLCHISKLFRVRRLDEDAVDTPKISRLPICAAPMSIRMASVPIFAESWNHDAYHVRAGMVVDQQLDTISHRFFSNPRVTPYRIRIINARKTFA